MDYVSVDEKIMYKILTSEELGELLPPIVRLTDFKHAPIYRSRLNQDLIIPDVLSFRNIEFSERDFNNFVSTKGLKKYARPVLNRGSYIDKDNNYIVQYFMTEDLQNMYRSRHDGGYRVEEAWSRKYEKEHKRQLPTDDWDVLRNLIKLYKFGSRWTSFDKDKLEEHYFKPKTKDELHIVFKKEITPLI